MTDEPDIRWKQRFQNFRKALKTLTEAVEAAAERELSDLEERGLIQSFEYTHELAWLTLKDFLEDQGVTQNLIGSRDATRHAFAQGLVEEGQTWMDMIQSRNQTTHTYNEETAHRIADDILKRYHAAFVKLEASLESRS